VARGRLRAFVAGGTLALALCAAIGARAGDPLDLKAEDAERLKPYLDRGALLLVEPKPDGGVGACTAMVSVAAPLDTAWDTVLDFRSYSKWVPRVVRTEVEKQGPTTFDVTYEIDVPGRNLTYTIRYDVDREKRVIDGRWLKGDLGSGRWTWHFIATGATSTTVSYAQENGDYSTQSRLLSALDDPRKTLSSGLGLASAFLMSRAAKAEMERRAPAPSHEYK